MGFEGFKATLYASRTARSGRAANDMDPVPLLDLRLNFYVIERACGCAK